MLTLLCLLLTSISQWLTSPQLQTASVGVSVVRINKDAKNGVSASPIFAYDAHRALAPASTQKLLITAAVLAECGEDAVFTTDVYLRGRMSSTGIWEGDMIIVGGGDALMGSQYSSAGPNDFVNRINSALREFGIKRITGRIIADARGEHVNAISPDWTWEDMGNHYAAGHFPLNYALNRYRLILDTSISGHRPKIKNIEPFIEGLTIENHLSAFSHHSDSAYLYGAPLDMHRRLYGAVPHRSKTFSIWGDIPNPPLYLVQYLTSALDVKVGEEPKAVVGEEVEIWGDMESMYENNLTSSRLPENKAYSSDPHSILLLRYTSDPLSYIIRITNHVSQNLLSESLLDLLINNKKSVGFPPKFLTEYWSSRGIDCNGVKLYDACGLAPTNRLSASFLTSMLVVSATDSAFVASLPLAGREGTVASFLKGTRLEGQARLKSGTTKLVVAYAGFVNGSDGQEYAVAIIVNNFTGSTKGVRQEIEKLLLQLVP